MMIKDVIQPAHAGEHARGEAEEACSELVAGIEEPGCVVHSESRRFHSGCIGDSECLVREAGGYHEREKERSEGSEGCL